MMDYILYDGGTNFDVITGVPMTTVKELPMEEAYTMYSEISPILVSGSNSQESVFGIAANVS